MKVVKIKLIICFDKIIIVKNYMKNNNDNSTVVILEDEWDNINGDLILFN